MADVSVGADGLDIDAQLEKLRAAFVERTWQGIGLLTFFTALGVPIRALQLNLSLAPAITSVGALALYAVLYLLRQRLNLHTRTLTPIAFLTFGATASLLRNGIQDLGMVYLVIASVLVAMHYPRKVFVSTFLVFFLIVLIAALGFITGAVPLRLGAEYAASPIAWIMGTVNVFSVTGLLLIGINTYNTSLHLYAQKVHEQHQALAKIVHHDPLTKLPNGGLLQDRIEMACHQSLRRAESVAVMFLDLDAFKSINDTHGHRAGDIVLREVAKRLSAVVRSVDTVGRLGGDEFVIVLNGIAGVPSAQGVAEKIMQAVAQPVELGGQSVGVGASLGVAMFPTPTDNPALLIEHADLAMYEAKRAGSGGYRMFEPRNHG